MQTHIESFSIHINHLWSHVLVNSYSTCVSLYMYATGAWALTQTFHHSAASIQEISKVYLYRRFATWKDKCKSLKIRNAVHFLLSELKYTWRVLEDNILDLKWCIYFLIHWILLSIFYFIITVFLIIIVIFNLHVWFQVKCPFLEWLLRLVCIVTLWAVCFENNTNMLRKKEFK